MVRFLAFALCALIALSVDLSAADDAGSTTWSGTYRGRVLTEKFLQRQSRSRSSAALSVEQPVRLLPDQGHIAVIDASGGVVAQPNFLDLQGASVLFSPNGDSYAGESVPVQFDDAARENGTPLALGDDDSQRIALPFSFPFFGTGYSEVFVNSDGNLTFLEGDTATSARSLPRAIAGSPRIAPLFVDLNPAANAAQVRAYVLGDRVVFTWDGVPQFNSSRRQIFQAALYDDGSFAFHYLSVDLAAALVGVFPGTGTAEPTPIDFSSAFTVGPSGGAELFQLLPNLDPMAATRRFYANHDDAYDFVFLFNNFALSPGPGTFAFELNVRNEITGIGDVLIGQETFDLGSEFGSQQRLSSFINFGALTVYPDDPLQTIPIIGEHNSLSILSHESGHRWGVYTEFLDPTTNEPSGNLLGRGDAHWSFYFNSEASFLEGNDILDVGSNASPRFTTGPAVARYSDFDLYAMGLLSPEEVTPSFLVEQSQNGSASRAPQSGVSFDGLRKEISIDAIIAAEGPRLPPVEMAQRSFNAAFVLLINDGAPPPTPEEVEKLDRIRRQWETYFAQQTAHRAEVNTELHRAVHLSVWPRAGVPVGKTASATVSIEKPLDRTLTIALSSDSSNLSVPPSVVIHTGETSVSLPILGLSAGPATLQAIAFGPGLSGFDSPRANIRVVPSTATLNISAVSGEARIGAAGAPLAKPIIVRVLDEDRTPIGGVKLTAVASGNGAASISNSTTGLDGLAEVSWTLASSVGPQQLTVGILGTSVSTAIPGEGLAGLPVFPAAGVVNGADLVSFGVSPGSIATVFGSNLAPSVAYADSFPLTRTLAGVQVFVNGIPVPLYYVSPGQINFQVPFSLTAATVSISVSSPSGISSPVDVPVDSYKPAIFRSPDTGIGAMHFPADGAIASDRPAKPGEGVEMFATGLGEVSSAPELGEPASSFVLARTTLQPTVSIGGQSVPATFSGLAPGLAGLYQVNFDLPLGLLPGQYEVTVEINGVVSDTVLLHVE